MRIHNLFHLLLYVIYSRISFVWKGRENRHIEREPERDGPRQCVNDFVFISDSADAAPIPCVDQYSLQIRERLSRIWRGDKV